MHVTRQTLELLDDQFLYERGTAKAREDAFLIKNNIETFLISPQYYTDPNVRYIQVNLLDNRNQSDVSFIVSVL